VTIPSKTNPPEIACIPLGQSALAIRSSPGGTETVPLTILNSASACGSQPTTEGEPEWHLASPSRLELADGTPADPPTFRAAVGDTIHLPHRTLRVVRVRDEDADQAPMLVVEPNSKDR
jgi:hypothetical protein